MNVTRCGYLPQVCILATALTTMLLCSQVCKDGWFGKGCKFKCRCSPSGMCEVDGRCINEETCMHGFFGPACQYADLVDMNSIPTTDIYLRDSNHSTCNPLTDATSVKVSLAYAFPLSWFRVHFNDRETKLNFTSTFNDGVNCKNERKFVVNINTVDVTCDIEIRVRVLQIDGGAAAHVCTIFISGGRNVALKQRTTQSSTYLMDIDTHGSDNAIDGDAHNASHSCAQTALERKEPLWRLTYNQAQVIDRIVIYNIDAEKHQPMTFKLETFQIDGSKIDMFTSSIPSSLSLYHIIVTSRTPISIILITQLKPSNDDVSLHLCEVETYSTAACGEDLYGLLCEDRCYCNNIEVCNHFTGVCTVGCPTGLYGTDCTANCSDSCLYGVCDYHIGHCLHCPPGYIGDVCDKECQSGTFGPECQLLCSQYCIDTCNFTNGYCECRERYTGSLCTECFPGLFDDDCNKTCSPNCNSKLCDMITGDCVSCNDNRLGPQCAECPHKHYGPTCNMKCNVKCLNGTCDSLSGECHSCVFGYDGRFCEHEWNIIWVYATPVLPLFFVLFCCLRKGRLIEVDEENSSQFSQHSSQFSQHSSEFSQQQSIFL